MAKYVPRVLLCGDEQEFRRIIGSKPVEVVGKVLFKLTGDEVNLFFDGRNLTGEDLRQLLDGAADYLIFTDLLEFAFYLENFPPNTQVISANTFANKIHDGFFSIEALVFLQLAINNEKIFNRVLDVDCYLAKNGLNTRLDFDAEFDCVAGNFALRPIHENIYSKIYRTFDECKYHTFDAILLTDERTPEEFIAALITLDGLSKNILTFARRGSALESWLQAAQNSFSQMGFLQTFNGTWYLLNKHVPPDDVCIYVVTHKDIKLAALPEGYRAIHAGHATAKEDFGYQGDDTGDNISHLNKFLDEVTALYWIWKNTSHTHTGFVHYRRFLMGNDTPQNYPVDKYPFNFDDILTTEEILKLLRDYDIIVNKEFIGTRNQRELIIWSTGQPDFVKTCEGIVRSCLERAQPDYLDAFDAVMNDYPLFLCGIHITRRNIFNDYCAWLFSFILDATKIMRDNIIIEGKKLEDVPHEYSRIASHLAERMLTVWLTKNHLRIKTLPIMKRDDV